MLATALSSENSVYQTVGALNFVDGSFSLTDTLPTITGKDGMEYKPLRSTLSADRHDGCEWRRRRQTELTTDYHATIALSAGGVAADFQTPYYTEYTVTATYDRDAFVLPFGDEENVSYENEAKLQYQLVGQVCQRAQRHGAGPIWHCHRGRHHHRIRKAADWHERGCGGIQRLLCQPVPERRDL